MAKQQNRQPTEVLIFRVDGPLANTPEDMPDLWLVPVGAADSMDAADKWILDNGQDGRSYQVGRMRHVRHLSVATKRTAQFVKGGANDGE